MILYVLAHVTTVVLNIVTLLVIISVAISWFYVDPYNKYVILVRRITDPMYRPFRWLINKVFSFSKLQSIRSITRQIDFSPMILMLVLVFLERSIPVYLMMLSYKLKQ